MPVIPILVLGIAASANDLILLHIIGLYVGKKEN